MSLTLIKEIKTKSSYDFDARRKVDALENDAKKEYVKEILKSLKDTFIKHNIAYIVGEFSGGNDEGGFDSVYLADSEKKEIIIKEENKREFNFFVDKKNIYRFDNEKEKKISVFYTVTNSEKNLLDVLDDTLYSTGALEEYGSFAGEFSVSGTVKLMSLITLGIETDKKVLKLMKEIWTRGVYNGNPSNPRTSNS
jgi:hypothetical protein